MRLLRAHPLLVSVVLAIGSSVVLLRILGAVNLPENAAHAADHLAVAVPVLVLAWSIAFWCPRRKDTRAAQWGRGAAVAGLAIGGTALVLESIGAFGYDGDDSRIGALTTLHNSVWLFSFLGFMVLLVGILLGVVSLFQRMPEPDALNI